MSGQSPSPIRSVSVIGLGKLGACVAACLANKGLDVVGVDVSERFVGMVNAGVAPVVEPRLQEMLTASRARLRATTDTAEAVRSTDATLIIVPTPSEDHGGFSLRYAAEAAAAIGRALREKAGYHLVVLTSTVLPGSTEYGIQPILESESGKRVGPDFGLCYSPEFIALGSVIRDFLNPDFLLIGESDARAGDLLEGLYREVVENEPKVARMNFANAELAKISVNTYVTMKISFANMLAALCEQIPGGDVDKVTGALGLDSRIGPRYLKGAVGYGGPCFPRDNQALAYLARQLGHPAAFAEATDSYNVRLLHRLAEKVREHLADGGRVAVLGMSYKPDTPVVEQSAGLLLASKLASDGARVVVHDPVALDNARHSLQDRVEYAASVEDAVRGSSVVIVMTPDRAYAAIDLGTLDADTALIDTWRLYAGRPIPAGVTHVPLGIAESTDALVDSLAQLWSASGEAVAS